ncbi:hypothetical protein ACCUM_1878 [Candidatus Accumulibacter phosphatis]|uniref:Uncharacterized protein n=1 Tax=Candidatus Accumulibacter phosphatis TaxID=327160 RepID=A0A5S4EIN8_9PROT|nr:hypothetical protein ACCUM_1878 [Candidatus Accumulibacter phosphatis]
MISSTVLTLAVIPANDALVKGGGCGTGLRSSGYGHGNAAATMPTDSRHPPYCVEQVGAAFAGVRFLLQPRRFPGIQIPKFPFLAEHDSNRFTEYHRSLPPGA